MWVLWVNILFFRYIHFVWPEFVHFRLQYYIPRQEHIIMYLPTILWCTFFTAPQYEARPNRAAINIKVHTTWLQTCKPFLWQVEQRGHKVCTHSASILPTSLPKWLNQFIYTKSVWEFPCPYSYKLSIVSLFPSFFYRVVFFSRICSNPTATPLAQPPLTSKEWQLQQMILPALRSPACKHPSTSSHQP